MFEIFLLLIMISATFAAGAYYGRAEEQKIVAAIVADVKSVQPTGRASDGTFSQSAALFYGKKFLDAVGYDALYLLTAIDPELETAVIAAGELVRKRRIGGSLTDSQSDPEVV